MLAPDSEELIERSERLYEQRWKTALEAAHPRAFVAIEPESAEYFLGPTVCDAAAACRAAHPDRRAYVLRVGHRAAVHSGAGDDGVRRCGWAGVARPVVAEPDRRDRGRGCRLDRHRVHRRVTRAVRAGRGSRSRPRFRPLRAVLADGSEVAVDTFTADVDWFDGRRRIEVIANDARFPLLGVGLLRGRKLAIDYAAATVALD